jgi:hypothetical protein
MTLKKKFQTDWVWNFLRAEDETRTRDPNLGKVVLYQLSYFRIIKELYLRAFPYRVPFLPLSGVQI